MDCPHFEVCGGCRPGPYPEELASKEARVQELLRPFTVEEWQPIVAAPEPWYYRNKMEYAFAVWDDRMVLGLREAGRFDHVIDLEKCLLMSPESFEVLQRVRTWAHSQGLSGYHRRRHEGDLRYLVLREGKNTGERMAVLIATGQGAQRCAPTLPMDLRSLLTTCWMGITDSQADVARAEDMRLLWGPGTITEKLGRITYRISPYSFFQTNTHGTEKLYELLRVWGGAFSSGALIDLYCGSGGITLALADCFDRVIGIDTNRDAIQDAQENAARNAIGHAEFVCEDALDFLKKLPASKVAVQLAAMVVDPPRVGLHPQALRALLEMNPPHLAYVSCNPESLARDLQSLVPFYRIRRVRAVDLFPHTPHVETLAFLEHR
jgi:23S rRNA (uracil1939-C5)-methyltransferase